jgi:hypothetical protein
VLESDRFPLINLFFFWSVSGRGIDNISNTPSHACASRGTPSVLPSPPIGLLWFGMHVGGSVPSLVCRGTVSNAPPQIRGQEQLGW